MFILSSLCFAQDGDTKPRVGIVMLRDKAIIGDSELGNQLFQKVDTKFKSSTYEYLSYSKLRNSFIDFCDKKDIKPGDK